MKRLLFLALIGFVTGCSDPVKYDLVVENIDLFDGNEHLDVMNIAINQDTIAAISHRPLHAYQIIDGSGKFMIPGLVNGHVHVSNIEHLKEGFPLGIITLLNMHTGLEARELEWKRMYRDSIGYSDLYGSGHAATVPGGHPNQFSPDMQTINDSVSIEHWLDERIENKVDFIKIVREHHEWMGYPPLPTLDYDSIRKLIEHTHERGYKAVIHSNTLEEMTRIAEFKPDGFVHMLEFKEDLPIPDNYYSKLANNDVFVIPTGGIALMPMDGAPPEIKEWVGNNLMNASERAEVIKGMHENGVLIVAGTDAQEGQMDFADDYFLELELYKLAGMTNLEILRTATGNAAKAFGLPIGELKVGGPANFVILTDSPLEDLDNLKKIDQVWKNGMKI